MVMMIFFFYLSKQVRVSENDRINYCSADGQKDKEETGMGELLPGGCNGLLFTVLLSSTQCSTGSVSVNTPVRFMPVNERQFLWFRSRSQHTTLLC